MRDAGAWRQWLAANGDKSDGVWLVLAKKGTLHPTSLTYDEALEEALCFGWIDGQTQRRDATTYGRRFTPRSARSAWSRRNVTLVEGLISAGRMQRAGAEVVEAARRDGRWDLAYAGQAAIEVPDDLRQALAAEQSANAMFDTLSSQNRYAILYRIGNARRPETRERRIAQFVTMLARGETLHPQAVRPKD